MVDIVQELSDINACDDRCRGRCTKCPNDTIREAVAEIVRLRGEIRIGAERLEIAAGVCKEWADRLAAL